MNLNQEQLESTDKVSIKERYYFFRWIFRVFSFRYLKKSLFLFYFIFFACVVFLVLWPFFKFISIIDLFETIENISDCINIFNIDKDIFIAIIDASSVFITGAILAYGSQYRNIDIYGLKFNDISSIRKRLGIIFVFIIILFIVSLINMSWALIIDFLLLLMSVYVLTIYENRAISHIKKNISKYWMKQFFKRNLDNLNNTYNDEKYILALFETKKSHENILKLFNTLTKIYCHYFYESDTLKRVITHLSVDTALYESIKDKYFEQFYALFSSSFDTINIELENHKTSETVEMYKNEILYSFYSKCSINIKNSKLDNQKKMLLLSTMVLKSFDCKESKNAYLKNEWLKEVKIMQLSNDEENGINFYNFMVFLFLTYTRNTHIPETDLLDNNIQKRRIPKEFYEKYLFDIVDKKDDKKEDDDKMLILKLSFLKDLVLINKYNLPKEGHRILEKFALKVTDNNIHEKTIFEIIRIFNKS